MEAPAAVFAALEDPRTGNAKRHLLLEILLIALRTLLSGGETWADMALFGRAKQGFLGRFLHLEHDVPSHDTFSRVFRRLDPVRFRACLVAFMRRFAETCQGVVAVDGKTLRRSFEQAADASPLHLVSAWSRASARSTASRTRSPPCPSCWRCRRWRGRSSPPMP